MILYSLSECGTYHNGQTNYSDQFKKMIKRYKKVYIACILCDSLVATPIMVYSFVFHFNWTSVGQAAESMMTLL